MRLYALKSTPFATFGVLSHLFQLKPSLHFEPRRVRLPTRHRTLPIRRGSRFSSLFVSNYSLPTRATSHWTSNTTSHTPNTTWFSLFLYFSLKMPTSYLSHVALDRQRDIATSQYDVAHAFSPFFPQITRFLHEPRRVGLPTRHGTLPTRHGVPPLYTKNHPRCTGGCLFFYLSSNVQSSLKLA